jgi:hypothetical protein
MTSSSQVLERSALKVRVHFRMFILFYGPVIPPNSNNHFLENNSKAAKSTKLISASTRVVNANETETENETATVYPSAHDPGHSTVVAQAGILS